MNQNILVVGANGYIGTNLVPFLLEQGHNVVACSREPEVLSQRLVAHSNLTIQHLDLAEPDLITRTLALGEFDQLFFLVHGMAQGSDFVDYELSLARNLTEQLSLDKVKQVIYLSSLMPKHTDSKHLLARKQTGDLLRQSDVPVIEVQSGVVIGPGSAAFEIMRDIVCNLPVIVAPKWVHNRANPIALEDLLFYLGELTKEQVTKHQTYEVCGPQVLTYAEQFAEIAKQAGVKHKLFTFSALSPKFASLWLRVLTSVPHTIGQALLQGLGHDFVGDNHAISQRFPRQLISYQQAVKSTLAQEGVFVRSEVWGFDEAALTRWQPGYGYYPKVAGAKYRSRCSQQQLWKIVKQLGSPKQGYFFANILWRTREWLDFFVGGGKPIRRQPEGDELKVGDHIDSWKVIKIDPNRFVSLLFGMKGPGLGRLEVSLTPAEDDPLQTDITIHAWWHPQGLFGLLYWYAMFPAHLFIFEGMVRAIDKKARQLAALN